MYAVIEAGGKQFRVTPGDSIRVDTLAGDVGAEVEFDRVLAEFEVRLDLNADLVPPRLLEVSLPTANPVMPTVVGADDPECRVPLDARIAEGDHRLRVTGVEGLDEPALELDVSV